MVMVIMSPLSELTDTDGFEMRSISQRAPPPRPRPCCSPSLSSTTERRVELPADGKAKFNSLSAAEAPVTHSWTPSGAPPQNPPPPSQPT